MDKALHTPKILTDEELIEWRENNEIRVTGRHPDWGLYSCPENYRTMIKMAQAEKDAELITDMLEALKDILAWHNVRMDYQLDNHWDKVITAIKKATGEG